MVTIAISLLQQIFILGIVVLNPGQLSLAIPLWIGTMSTSGGHSPC